ncbi:MAG: hypothetical protein WC567_03860 [Kiritimatiellia bacterium]
MTKKLNYSDQFNNMNSFRCNPDGEENQKAMYVHNQYVGALKIQMLDAQRDTENNIPVFRTARNKLAARDSMQN